jgi:hypothetical protein
MTVAAAEKDTQCANRFYFEAASAACSPQRRNQCGEPVPREEKKLIISQQLNKYFLSITDATYHQQPTIPNI